MKKWRLFLGILSLSLIGLISLGQSAMALPIQYGGNGNYYELIIPQAPITWGNANIQAASMFYMGYQGHLVTITDAGESAFITANFGPSSVPAAAYQSLGGDRKLGPWIGAFQTYPAPSPADGWNWVTGEAWSFTNWHTAPPEPNDSPTAGEQGEENYGMLDWRANTAWYPNGPMLAWNDVSRWNERDNYNTMPSYLVEYTVPEPTSLLLLGTGLLGAALLGRRRK